MTQAILRFDRVVLLLLHDDEEEPVYRRKMEYY